jgi:selenocysteine lyase/cysteine desulfurase
MTGYEAFLRLFPEYAGTSDIDRLRAVDYPCLDESGEVYLDYTGGALYARSQVRAHADVLGSAVFGNPHSSSPASRRMTALVERARQAVLDWFGAPAGDYVAIFTPNTTGALRLVGEAYPFAPDAGLLLAVDNHNSVNGIREFARARGAPVAYAPLTTPELRLDLARLEEALAAGRGLFAFPAQSNFSGVRHPLSLIEQAHAARWHVLLDAAAFVPTNQLDLAAVRPDFVAVSFYKMFGYPTGVGCLLARTEALASLRRPWFSGGTVNFATVRGRAHILAPGEAGFEDGTSNYLAIPAVEIGLAHLRLAGMDRLHTRVRCLTAWLLQELVALRHGNGAPMVRVYGPITTADRGGTIAMNFYDPDGHLLDYRRVEELAAARGISLRTGCFCNPGVGETAEGVTEDDVRAALEADPDMTLPRFLQAITHRGGRSVGAMRVSLGLASNFDDVAAFVAFAADLRDQTKMTMGEVTFDIASCRVIRDGS